MSQVINTNILSLNTQNNLNKSQSVLGTAIERLSSGMRINSAKDDAAGQAIVNRFTANVRGLTQAARNANDGISMAQTAEGAVNEINNNLQRIRELTVQAKNGSNSESDIKSLQEEVSQRLAEIDRISAQTDFNGNKVLSKDGAMTIQVGAFDNQTISLDFKKIDSSVLKVNEVDLSKKGQIGQQVKNLSETEDKAVAAVTAEDAINFKAEAGQKLYESTTKGEYILEKTTPASGGGAATIEYYKVTKADFETSAGADKGKIKSSALATAVTSTPTLGAEMVDGEEVYAEVKGVTGVTAKAAIKLGAGEELFHKLDANGNVDADKFLIKKDDQYFEVKRDNFSAISGEMSTATAAVKLDPTAAISMDIHDEPLKALDDALKTVDTMRSTLGAVQNRMESTIQNLNNTMTNLSAARSRIQDADFATEVSNMSKGQILQQTGTAVLAQANQSTQGVLSLLR
ncbi:FliC/FljB family flagellin [Providencia stuartii]|uniref:FliC/FljB family flagellin n=1 Tax=Providencia TaxID=586 RepID=UPI0027E82BF1|nr:FliC/FljB family flagellin [Providencia sp. 2023EL-00965]ELR5299173.1 FliC/FljB family flagellin [Providencia stuartii]MDW7587373.1 FliC/FljB family flagellin [Providencia sp. 2023EL-00965]